jgi:hypothetical protein
MPGLAEASIYTIWVYLQVRFMEKPALAKLHQGDYAQYTAHVDRFIPCPTKPTLRVESGVGQPGTAQPNRARPAEPI